jgi:hypothetical protein
MTGDANPATGDDGTDPRPPHRFFEGDQPGPVFAAWAR